MRVGYIRVSTEEQNTARQKVIMQELGVDRVYIEKVSGKSRDREQLTEMLDFLREGDCLVVESISRLSRCVKDLLDIMAILDSKGVTFISQKESLDTGTPVGKFMLVMFGAMAEMEREYILSRQREGIAIARANGKYKGRKPIEVPEDRFSEVHKRWRSGEIKAVEAMAALGLRSGTFYRRVKEFEGRE